MTNEILKTQNETWGFWGTTLNNYSKNKLNKDGMMHLKHYLNYQVLNPKK